MPQIIASNRTSRASKSVRGLADRRDARVITVEICEELTFTSAGTGAYVSKPIDPVLDGLGPEIQDLVVHVLGRAFSANFKYKVTAERSYDGEVWTAFAAELLSEQTTTGYKTSSAYSTRTDFGLLIRFKVETSDAGAKEIGTLSITVAIRLFQ